MHSVFSMMLPRLSVALTLLFIGIAISGPCEKLQETSVKQCGKNEVLTCTCGHNTCAQPQLTHVIRCIRCQDECVCKDGYVRDGAFGDPCIPIDQCAPKAPSGY
ncbi:inducible metalloproteinase inhibitor protein-like [Uranotaenia lowii]|uniref:inducible metalloproteinase inhibitor protein-like n=1 Tax=Uranotaenia lowii TaxID=190385 RepID=UPI002479443B|nr:inducible metalloproteinase inhibitor protein-like [Uranotaenia lowii]